MAVQDLHKLPDPIDISINDIYPLPSMDDNLDALSGAKVFSTLDLTLGY